MTRPLATGVRAVATGLMRLAQRIDGAYLNPVWFANEHSDLFFEMEGQRVGWKRVGPPGIDKGSVI